MRKTYKLFIPRILKTKKSVTAFGKFVTALLLFILLILPQTASAYDYPINEKNIMEVPIADSGLRFPLNAPFSRGFVYGDIYPEGYGNLTGTPHFGVDYIAGDDKTVYAVAHGIVVRKKLNSETYDKDGKIAAYGYGYYVVIAHRLPESNELVYSLYAHLKDYSKCPDEGEIVNKGDEIGIQGNSGNPGRKEHLHFEIRKKLPPDGNLDANNYHDPDKFIQDYQGKVSQAIESPSQETKTSFFSGIISFFKNIWSTIASIFSYKPGEVRAAEPEESSTASESTTSEQTITKETEQETSLEKNEYNPQIKALYAVFKTTNNSDEDTADLFVLDLNNRQIKKLISVTGLKEFSFSPDFTKVIIDNVSGEWYSKDFHAEIRIIDINEESSNVIISNDNPIFQNFWDNPVFFTDPIFSPDGNKIAFGCMSESYDVEGNSDLFIMDINGKNLENLTNNKSSNRSFSFSSNGNEIVYVGMHEIYIQDINGKNKIKLSNTGYLCNEPSFAPDGGKIIFISGPEIGMAIAWKCDLYMVDINGKNQLNLTNNSAENRNPLFSPDSKKIVFNSTKEYKIGDDGIDWEGSDLYIIDINTKVVERLTNNPDRELPIAFSPDAKKIIYVTYNSEWFPKNLFEIDLINKRNNLLFELKLDEFKSRDYLFKIDWDTTP